MKKRRFKKFIILLVFFVLVALEDYFNIEIFDKNLENIIIQNETNFNVLDIPEYKEKSYSEINNNIPEFTEKDLKIEEDYYTEIKNDKAGMAMIKTSWKKSNQDDEKDDYSSIIPSGFKQKKYDTSIIPGGYLYHRCHLIAWKLGGIDVDKRNIITGTQCFNIDGMKEFEDKVYDYLKENKTNQVLYRVTPDFKGNNELANGVQIEAYSIEDMGKLQFNVYIYNVQNGISIDYTTGESKLLKTEENN